MGQTQVLGLISGFTVLGSICSTSLRLLLKGIDSRGFWFCRFKEHVRGYVPHVQYTTCLGPQYFFSGNRSACIIIPKRTSPLS
jgi:hypothetical protein